MAFAAAFLWAKFSSVYPLASSRIVTGEQYTVTLDPVIALGSRRPAPIFRKILVSQTLCRDIGLLIFTPPPPTPPSATPRTAPPTPPSPVHPASAPPRSPVRRRSCP